MILAAGRSTRLGELGLERPKPLLPVLEVPLVRWALALLRGTGVEDVIVNTHHLGTQIAAELGNEVTYSHEQPDILGTGGGVRRAAGFFGGERFFLVNGKIVIDVPLEKVLAHHVRTGALATLVVRRDLEAARWGAVDVDETAGCVRAIRGSAGEYMFTGVHVIEPALVDRLPDGPSDIVGDGYLPALASGEIIGAYVMDGYFWEHSTPARYLAGNLNLLHGARVQHAPIVGPPDRVAESASVSASARIVPPVHVAAGARVEAGATVGPAVVLGHGAHVHAGVALARAVVFPDAEVTTSATDVIVTPTRQVPAEPAPP